MYEGAGQSYALLFPSGKFARPMAGAMVQSHRAQRVACTFLGLAVASEQKRKLDILLRREAGKEIEELKDQPDSLTP
jgi:hypothetical protein